MSPAPLSRLISDAQVVEIRTRYATDATLTHPGLAQEYGIGHASVTRILHGKYRPELGGPFTVGCFHKAPITPGDCDILYSLEAAAGYLNIRQSTVREYLRRGDLLQESAGMVPLDSLEAYQIQHQYFEPPQFQPAPPPTCCQRCGLLKHDNGLCAFCQAELAGGGFVLYQRAADI